MSFKIVTDSGSDITQSEAVELGVTVLPFNIRFGQEEYKDGINLGKEDFYNMLETSEELPTTAAVTPFEFEDTIDGDTLIITLSSKLSCTYQNAVIAASEHANVRVIDSLQATISEGILVKRAIELKNQGLSLDEAYKILEEEKKKIRIVALVDTLLYLKKGGRISPTVAFIGNFLKIKPVISVIDGAVEVIDKARGAKNAQNMLRKLTREEEIDYSMPYSVAFSGNDDTLVRAYLEESNDIYPEGTNFPLCKVGAVIGTHIGPNAIAAAFFKK